MKRQLGNATPVESPARAGRPGLSALRLRTMTSGIFQREASFLAPEWDQAHSLYDAALKFVLSDSRVHTGIIGMRWPHEVEQNVRLVEGWTPPTDFADMPRVTFGVYKADDEAAPGLAAPNA